MENSNTNRICLALCLPNPKITTEDIKMGIYPGYYYYQKPVSCSACLDDADMFGDDPDCKKCQDSNRVKVRLLKLSGRLFRHEAIVQHICTGKIESVPIRCLTFGGNDDW